ncbi:MAG: bifunctional proline dehydrogenase/L-glutamate gamma-semialdehyde dehydrogenase, partial [Phycisphaerae bacterium]|nr:bifunctional proline dehydrogenase/L-glutamate gamma-semialdehyde dehydrogenase [Phycisphaerae bacterium]
MELSAALAEASVRLQSRRERNESAQMARMMRDEAGKAFTLAMVDRAFRSASPIKQSHRVRDLLDRYGLPHFLPPLRRWMLKSGAAASRWLPAPVMSAMRKELRSESSRVILDSAPASLARYLNDRRAAGMRVNLNHLGEAVLGEAEAERRLDAVIAHLSNPLVDYVSVKISSIFSQINILDFHGSLAAVKDRMRTLYRAAMPLGKFFNLDMEEYRDLALTLAAFGQVLDEPEFKNFSAGMVLQAYLPDSWIAQQELVTWAQRRVAAGGAAIKLRIVKGANLAMERVEAELHGWNPAPYDDKAKTDANFCRMLEFGCRSENAAAVRLGVGTHNLFDVALALVLREQSGTRDRVELEMLEGMANHEARAVKDEAGGILLYAPVVSQRDFLSALSYLVRRLDENTASENYLHDLFDLHPGTAAWQRQNDRFIASWENRHDASSESHRKFPAPISADVEFYNTADTDWTQRDRRAGLHQSIEQWRAPDLPPLSTLNDVLSTAVAAQPAWESLGAAGRSKVLRRAADAIETARFDTIVQMMHEGKKAAIEADFEVSEAADATRFAAATAEPSASAYAEALGVIVVTPPWNFPYAIPCIGVTAALAAGNSVILKPAPESVGVAWRLANHLWSAGVPREVLQYFPCSDGEEGKSLITNPRVSAVVLTGAYETARMFLDWRPSLRLFAETSGKNAIIITAQADRDLAIKDLVKSAFSHSGQKCSAASLAILEAEVYDD